MVIASSPAGSGANVLDDGKDIPFRVLEPRRLRAAAGGDTVDGLQAWLVVLLEGHAARFQIRDFPLDVVDAPERLAGAVGAGVRRGVEKASGAAGEVVRDTARNFFSWTEAELPLVERAGASDVFRRQIRVDRRLLQHEHLLSVIVRSNASPRPI